MSFTLDGAGLVGFEVDEWLGGEVPLRRRQRCIGRFGEETGDPRIQATLRKVLAVSRDFDGDAVSRGVGTLVAMGVGEPVAVPAGAPALKTSRPGWLFVLLASARIAAARLGQG